MAELTPDTADPRATAELVSGGASPVVKLSGELDLSTLPIVEPVMDKVLAESPQSVVVDLSGLTFMDSSGIGFLLRTAGAVESVELRHASLAIRRLIELTGLQGVLPLT